MGGVCVRGNAYLPTLCPIQTFLRLINLSWLNRYKWPPRYLIAHHDRKGTMGASVYVIGIWPVVDNFDGHATVPGGGNQEQRAFA